MVRSELSLAAGPFHSLCLLSRRSTPQELPALFSVTAVNSDKKQPREAKGLFDLHFCVTVHY